MSQSKMEVVPDDEKKFVLKHTFKDIMSMEIGDEIHGPIEYHYNIPWKIRVKRKSSTFNAFLDCQITDNSTDWSIDVITTRKCFKEACEETYPSQVLHFSPTGSSRNAFRKYWHKTREYLIDGKFTFELMVLIEKTSGIEKPLKLRNFDDDAAKEDSDVTLIVKDTKFYVLKKYLASHSTYFKSLFSGNFPESEKSVIELKDIDPEEFQHFLELIYGEASVEAHSVSGILHLGDFFDSKTAIRRSEEFLIYKSKMPLKDRFHAATKYKLEKLKEKCISELNTPADCLSIIPEDPSQFEASLWKELFIKAAKLGQ